ATENVLLFAAKTPGTTLIQIADQDYQVQELIKVLEKMGASVEPAGPHAYRVRGRKDLGGFKHRLMYDPIEAGTFIVLGAAVQGGITVKNVETGFLQLFLKHIRSSGIRLEILKGRNGAEDVKVAGIENFKMEKIQSMIYPGVSSDLQSVLGVLATQAKGSTLLHDPLYEGRLKYLEEINKMGAEIYFTDPHRAIINGPTKLRGTDLGAFDLRGGAAVVIAALIAKGQSTISNIYQIDRGYERIEERLQALGADIQRIRV
ncbi:MAG: UDP-N-acetylglucosamine 1-carboxyvinyltransferase, partial [Candidatus Pacearchaeota archaeon]|nr:UDP-N-acetylglucosamine 1-carboxyvinyltransferase [Candidatus Pacearchaeota archaeon]